MPAKKRNFDRTIRELRNIAGEFASSNGQPKSAFGGEVAHVWAVDDRGRKIFVAIATERESLDDEPLLEGRDFAHEFEQHVRAFRLKPLKAAPVAEKLPALESPDSAEPVGEPSDNPAQDSQGDFHAP